MVHTGAAGAVSLALHGLAVWILIALASAHPIPPPPPTLTPVEMVSTAPAAPAALPVSHEAPSARPVTPHAGAGVDGRRAPTARTQPVAPRTMQSLADLQVHYEDTTRFVDHDRAPLADTTTRIGRTNIDGVMGVPDAPAGGSHARGPRPKHDYTNLRIGGASKFAGLTIELRLSIDARGRVRAVKVLRSVDREIDLKTVAIVQKFEYDPALDDNGAPIAGTQRWVFQVVDDDEF